MAIEPNCRVAVYWHMRYPSFQSYLQSLLVACFVSVAAAGASAGAASTADYNLPSLGEPATDSNLPEPGAAATDYNLPSMGEPANNTLSPREEKRIGGRIFTQFLQAGHIIEDPELRQYVSSIGARLVNATSHSTSEFRFFVVNSPAINAFALPGGYIGINAGLILATRSESELAGVLAHEISHVTQRHIARQIAATKGMKWATLAAMLGAAIAGGGDPDAVQAAITGGMSIMQQQQITYTRVHELEADRIGIRLLAKAHFDPKAMAAFFETMQRHASLYGNKLPQILLTHPVSNTRIAEARARAADYPSPQVIESVDYASIKERVRFLTTFPRSDLLTYYQRLDAPQKTSAAQDYGYALVLAHSARASRAVDILQRLVAAHPQQPLYVTALSRAQGYAGQPGAALATLQNALDTFPDDRALLLQYAINLRNGGQPDAARAFVQTHPQLLQHSYKAQALLAQIAGAAGKFGEAYYRRAMYRRMRGAYVPAIRQLRATLHNASLRQLDRTRLEALLDQIITQCKVAWPDGKCKQLVLRLPR